MVPVLSDGSGYFFLAWGTFLMDSGPVTACESRVLGANHFPTGFDCSSPSSDRRLANSVAVTWIRVPVLPDGPGSLSLAWGTFLMDLGSTLWHVYLCSSTLSGQ